MKKYQFTAKRNPDSAKNVRPTRMSEKFVLSEPQKKMLREYFMERESKLEIITTTKTPNGQVLDWIPIESQIREGKIAQPPPLSDLANATEHNRRVQLTTFELERKGAKLGPNGTVPVLRRDISKLTFNKMLKDFLSKHGVPTRTLLIDSIHPLQQPEVGAPHDHVTTSQNVTCYGGEGYISAFDPYTWYSDEFSLGQIAIIGGSGSGMQTVEAGHQKYRDLYGDWVPHLFVFYTTNNYTNQGNNIGGYNQDVDGWVQYSNLVYPGAISSPLSTPGGLQYNMFIKYQLYQQNWWLRCNNNWIGYYPANLFSATGLLSQGSTIQFFGEIVDSSSHVGATKTDMGSGNWPGSGWQWAAFQRNLKYQSDQGGFLTDFDGAEWTDDAREYDIESHMNSGTSWGSYFWWGGPGAG